MPERRESPLPETWLVDWLASGRDGDRFSVSHRYGAGSTLGLRYADIWYGGAFGKVSIGQGDQGGEGSVYSGSAATGAWIGHGMDQSTLTKDAAEPAVAVPGAAPLLQGDPDEGRQEHG